jgi:hypothetical protein
MKLSQADFQSEEGDITFLRDNSIRLQDYTVLKHRNPQSQQ